MEESIAQLEGTFTEKADKLAEALLNNPDKPETSVEQMFAPGVYLRKFSAPGGVMGLGHAHKTEHFNIILKGRVRVMIGEEVIQEVKKWKYRRNTNNLNIKRDYDN